MKCPVCHQSTGYYYQQGIQPGTMERHVYPLYQRSYPRSPDYVSPRCHECYKKVEAETTPQPGPPAGKEDTIQPI